MNFIGLIIIAILFWLIGCIKILREYERGVIFRLGRMLEKAKGPGLIFVFQPIDRMIRISTRLVVMDVPPQDIITRDNVSVKVNAVIYFRVILPNLAVVEVENYLYATSQLTQTTLRSVLGHHDLDDLLSRREKINHDLQSILDNQTDPWGIKVSNVEVKDVDLPNDMQRAMARQAEAERERRAKVIAAEGEYEASEKMRMAAQVMSKEPMALQMRYLQTLREIAVENNTTTIFPIPLDLFKVFFNKSEPSSGDK